MDQPLNELESAILAILNQHKGRENAIRRAELVRLASNSLPSSFDKDREIRRTLEHLTERHSEWIGSLPSGYFIIATDEDRKKVKDYYKSYALSILHRAARVDQSTMAKLLGQLSLEFEEKRP